MVMRYSNGHAVQVARASACRCRPPAVANCSLSRCDSSDGASRTDCLCLCVPLSAQSVADCCFTVTAVMAHAVQIACARLCMPLSAALCSLAVTQGAWWPRQWWRNRSSVSVPQGGVVAQGGVVPQGGVVAECV